MTLTVEFWTLAGIMVAFLGSASGLVWKLINSVIGQAVQRIDDHFVALEKSHQTANAELSRRLDLIEKAGHDESAQWMHFTRELSSIKADLPLQYVRREDYVRGQSVVEAKLDSLAAKLELLQQRGLHP